MAPKRKDLSKFAKSLLDDDAKESSQLGRELEDGLDGDFDEEMVSPCLSMQNNFYSLLSNVFIILA